MWHLDPRLRGHTLSSALLAAFACAALAADASAADAKADLEKLGVKVSGTQAVLLEEVEFGKELSFGPQASFRANLRKLKSLEDLILSEDIPLVRDGGVQRVSVMVNAEHVEPMVVDSGCGSMLVPHRLAEKFSVQATVGDQEVTCVLADGRIKKTKQTAEQSFRTEPRSPATRR